jgi:hypothetical protein
MRKQLNVSGAVALKSGRYFQVFSSCAAVHGIHKAAKDSIPPLTDDQWKDVIDFSSPYGNKVESTHHSELDKDDPLKCLALLGGENLHNKQVLIIRDDTSPNIIFSFVDREKEKELYGDEKERGIERVEFCIPEIFRKMSKDEVQEAKKKYTNQQDVEAW